MAPKNKTEVVNIRIVGLLIIEQKLCSRDPADAVRCPEVSGRWWTRPGKHFGVGKIHRARRFPLGEG
jgi:hypothetical protein